MATDVPEGSVVIAPAEVYARVLTLTDVVTKLVAADETETESRRDMKARLERAEQDISAIKQKIWFVAGVCSALGGGIGSALASTLGK